MTRQILSIAALLFSSAFLMFAGGINTLILPVRGGAEGFSATQLGLIGTGWALGYVLGCLMVPRLVARVGHIRAFSVMAALAGCALLTSLLIVAAPAWIALRGVSGFCFAGAAMIVESWLNERADVHSRGKIFGVYTMVNLGGSTLGQMAVGFGPTNDHFFFVLGAMFYALALVPTAITSSVSPKPLVQSKLNIPALWRNSPVAVVTALLIGVSNSAFGTLAAVYAASIGLPVSVVALFASLPILAGAIAQIPIGYLSDRMDRRIVLSGVAVAAIAADATFVVVKPDAVVALVALASLFGATIYTMYPLIIAHANDHAAPGTHIQTSGGLLLLYGIGAIVGPLAAGFTMSLAGPHGLFVTTIVAHIGILGYAVWRIARRAAVDTAHKTPFLVAPNARAATPQTTALAIDEEPTAPPMPALPAADRKAPGPDK